MKFPLEMVVFFSIAMLVFAGGNFSSPFLLGHVFFFAEKTPKKTTQMSTLTCRMGSQCNSVVVNASVNTSSATGIPKEPTWDPSVHLGSRWKPNLVKGLQCCVVTYLDRCAPEKKPWKYIYIY